MEISDLVRDARFKADLSVRNVPPRKGGTKEF